MKKLNIGMVGLGRMGKEYAKNIHYKVNNANLIAVCSIVDEELLYARSELEIEHTYTNYDKLLKHPDLDAIVIITSTSVHASQIIKALYAGLHVFCEKPLAISIEECLEVGKVAKRFPELIVMIGFVRRYDVSYMDAKKVLDENKIGMPFFVRSQTADKDEGAKFQIEFVKKGGGIFHDFNVHDADLAHWFLGSKVKRVWSQGSSYRFKEFGEAGDADNTFAFCEFENGTMALLGASRTCSYGHDTFTEIIATEGKLLVGQKIEKNRLQIGDKNGIRYECVSSFYERFYEAFLLQIQDFIVSVLEGRQPECDIENATYATIVTTALTKSFKTKGIVEIKDVIPNWE